MVEPGHVPEAGTIGLGVPGVENDVSADDHAGASSEASRDKGYPAREGVKKHNLATI